MNNVIIHTLTIPCQQNFAYFSLCLSIKLSSVFKAAKVSSSISECRSTSTWLLVKSGATSAHIQSLASLTLIPPTQPVSRKGIINIIGHVTNLVLLFILSHLNFISTRKLILLRSLKIKPASN